MHYAGMPIDLDAIRQRISNVIDRDDDLSIRNVSIAAIGSDSALHKFLTEQNKSIKVDNLAAIADAIGVSLSWLLFGTNAEQRDAPSLQDLEDMIGTAFEEVQDDMPPELILRTVASVLHGQLGRPLGAGEVRRLSGVRIARDKLAQSPAPTTRAAQAK